MADFPLPKSPGGANWSTGPRFTPIKITPGPLDYETASTCDMSRSVVSRCATMPSLSFTTYIPGSPSKRSKAQKPEGDNHLLDLPRFPAASPARGTNAPVYSISSKVRCQTIRTPGVGQYREPVHDFGPSNRPKIVGVTSWAAPRVRDLGIDDRFGGDANHKSVEYPSPNAYTLESALSQKDCLPFTGRGKSAMMAAAGRSPGPQFAGSAAAAKDSVMRAPPSLTIGLKQPLCEVRESPSPNTYQARSLYWSGNKRPLGRSITPHGRRHTAVPMSLHKDVQAMQF